MILGLQKDKDSLDWIFFQASKRQALKEIPLPLRVQDCRVLWSWQDASLEKSYRG